jgi:putative resolvase
MKLSEYAKRVGISYKTAYRWWQAGKLDAYQLDTGTIIVREETQPRRGRQVALYARVSGGDQKADVERQRQRLRDYAAAQGYQVASEVIEIASGLNDNRPKLNKLLSNPEIGIIVVEHRDRLTRFGFNYIQLLLEQQGRRVEVLNLQDTSNDLVDDFIAVISSMSARVYGRRRAKQRVECIRKCLATDDGDPTGL